MAHPPKKTLPDTPTASAQPSADNDTSTGHLGSRLLELDAFYSTEVRRLASMASALRRQYERAEKAPE